MEPCPVRRWRVMRWPRCAPRRSCPDHRGRRFGQDRGRLAAGRRPAGGRRAAGVDRRLHVHREGRGGAQGAHRRAGRGASRREARSTSSAGSSSARSTPTASGCCRARAAVRDVHVLDENQLTLPGARGEPARASSSSTRRTAVRVDRRLPARASTSSRTSCSTRTTLPEPFRDGARATTTRCSTATGSCRSGSRSSGRSRELEQPELAPTPSTPTLRHLIVDEYQDVNPAQERLIELLTGPDASSAWSATTTRRSTSGAGRTSRNIVTFRDRYPNVATVPARDQPAQPAGRSSSGEHVRRVDPGTASEDDGGRSGPASGSPRS